MSEALPATAAAVADVVAMLAAAFGRRCSPELVTSFVRTVGNVNPSSVRAAGQSFLFKEKMPTPIVFKREVDKREPKDPNQPQPRRPTQYFVCTACGEKIATDCFEAHGRTCEFVVRRMQGLPPVDAHEVRLRGLVNCRGTEEDATNLKDYLTTRGQKR